MRHRRRPASPGAEKRRAGSGLAAGLVAGAGLCAGIHVLLDWLDRPRARGTAAELQLMLDSVGEGIYGTDAAGRCTFVNRAALRMLGYDNPGALLGASMHETIHHTRQDGSPYPATDCPMLAVLRDLGSVTLGEEVVWRRDGAMLPIRYSSFPLTREGRWVAGAVVTFVDVTERRRTERLLATQHRVQA